MSRTDDLNYYNDRRVIAGEGERDFHIVAEGSRRATVKLSESVLEMLIEEGVRPEAFDGQLEVPFEYEVCDLCDGHGTHVNPSIDCNGLTAEDFAEDPDFAEDYKNGVYDVRCAQCHGKRVTPVVTFPDDIQKVLDSWHAGLADSRRCEMAERMMGA